MMFSLLSEDLHSLLEAMVESYEEAIFSKTLDGLVVSWNSGAERLYGYSAHEMVGRPISLLVPADRRPELAAILHRLAEGQRLAPFETVRRRKDGCLVDVSVTISPVKDATGRIIGASTMARDITECKQAEERQRVLQERLLEVAQGIGTYNKKKRSTIRQLAGTEEAYLLLIRELERVESQCFQARRFRTEATLTLVEWLETLNHFGWLCAYCQSQPFQVLSHYLPFPQGGTTAANCVPACYRCRRYREPESVPVQVYLAQVQERKERTP